MVYTRIQKFTIMGHQDIEARLRIDYSALKLVSEDANDTTVKVTTPASGSSYGASSAPKTGDYDNYAAIPVVMLIAAAAGVMTMVYRKRQAK